MRKIKRDELLDYATYTDKRPEILAEVLESKKTRRIHVGEYLTLLFENHLSMLYQIQEMMRIERMVREKDIQHEIDTYNEVLGGDGELGCTLLIEIDSPEQRAVKLVEWIDLPSHLFVRLDDGKKIYADFDPRQVGDGRLSSVQYIKFKTKGAVPVAIGSDLPALTVETALAPEQRDALAADLAG